MKYILRGLSFFAQDLICVGVRYWKIGSDPPLIVWLQFVSLQMERLYSFSLCME